MVTVPVKPLRLFTLTVAEALEPAKTVIALGIGTTLKSTKLKEIVTE
jgi:hypothetical protein